MVLYNDNVNCLLEQLEPKGIQVLLDYGPTVRKLFSNFFSKEGSLRKQAHKLLDSLNPVLIDSYVSRHTEKPDGESGQPDPKLP